MLEHVIYYMRMQTKLDYFSPYVTRQIIQPNENPAVCLLQYA